MTGTPAIDAAEKSLPLSGGGLGGGLNHAQNYPAIIYSLNSENDSVSAPHLTSPREGEEYAASPCAATVRTLKIEASVENARDLRKTMTDAERKLWQILRKEQLGVRFRKQHPVGRYIADFASLVPKLIIELDGGQHNTASAITYDHTRSAALEAEGFTVLRFWNNEVFQNTQGVVDSIMHTLEKLRNANAGGA